MMPWIFSKPYPIVYRRPAMTSRRACARTIVDELVDHLGM